MGELLIRSRGLLGRSRPLGSRLSSSQHLMKRRCSNQSYWWQQDMMEGREAPPDGQLPATWL